jgi:hypothetical protein
MAFDFVGEGMGVEHNSAQNFLAASLSCVLVFLTEVNSLAYTQEQAAYICSLLVSLMIRNSRLFFSLFTALRRLCDPGGLPSPILTVTEISP